MDVTTITDKLTTLQADITTIGGALIAIVGVVLVFRWLSSFMKSRG